MISAVGTVIGGFLLLSFAAVAWLLHARKCRVMELRIAQLQVALRQAQEQLTTKQRESMENFQLAVKVAYRFAIATDQTTTARKLLKHYSSSTTREMLDRIQKG